MEAGFEAGVTVTLSPSSKSLKGDKSWVQGEQAAPAPAVQEAELDVAAMVSAMFKAALADTPEDQEMEEGHTACPKPQCCIVGEEEQLPDVDVAEMVAAMFVGAARADMAAAQEAGENDNADAEIAKADKGMAVNPEADVAAAKEAEEGTAAVESAVGMEGASDNSETDMLAAGGAEEGAAAVESAVTEEGATDNTDADMLAAGEAKGEGALEHIAVAERESVAAKEGEAGPAEEKKFDVQAFVAAAFAAALAAEAVHLTPLEVGFEDAEDESLWQSPTKSNFIPVFETTEEYLARLEVEQQHTQQLRGAAAAGEMHEEEHVQEVELPEGYIPRGRCLSPIEKKIKAIQEEWANVPFDPKPHVSRLEREVAMTKCAVPSPSRVVAQRMVQAAFESSLRSASQPKSPSIPSLSEVLKVHKSKLELDKEAAVAAAATEAQRPPSRTRVVAPAWEGPSLEEIGTHKSRLEKEKEAAVAAAAEQQQQPKRGSRVTAPAWDGPSLSDIGTHKSKLEREKEAAVAAAVGLQQQPRQGSRVAAPAWEGPSLGEIGPHKSRLEREKEAAMAAAEQQPQPRRGSRVAAPAWEGPSLGEIGPHKSRLEREKEAAAAAAAAQPQPARRSRVAAPAWDGPGLGEIGPHKSRLEREKEAAAAAAAEQQQQQSRRSRVPAPVWDGPGLGEIGPHKSKLEREKEAWLAAEAIVTQRRATSNTVLASPPLSAQPTEDSEVAGSCGTSPVTFPVTVAE